MFRVRLTQLESHLQALIEGGAKRLVQGRAPARALISSLLTAQQTQSRVGRDGRPVAPNLYTIFLAEAQAEVLLNNPAVVDELARTLYEAGSEAGLIFESPPVVRIVADPQLTLGDFNVQVQNSLDRLPQTTDIVLPKDSSQETIPRNAFLIVDGMQIFQLDQAVVNIGRRSDNQLVIDDRRISRLHAQLRAIRGRFVVFDLDSAGGTWVNGQRVLQHTLVPGDVISLSGVPLVYGQDSVGQDETQDINPIPG